MMIFEIRLWICCAADEVCGEPPQSGLESSFSSASRALDLRTRVLCLQVQLRLGSSHAARARLSGLNRRWT